MIEKSVLEVSEILKDANIASVILDVREKWEYDICHIENSVHIPMGKITEKKDELNQNDMIHPNKKGVKKIVENIYPYFIDFYTTFKDN